MTTQFFLTDSVGSGIQMDLAATDSGFIGAGVNVLSNNNHGAHLTGSNQRIDVLGTLYGTTGILVTADTPPDNTTVSVHAGGTVIGSTYGIYAYSDNILVANDGTISSRAYALFLSGDAVRIINTGLIEASGGNVYPTIEMYSRSNTAGSEAQLINHGTITSDSYAIYGDGDFGDRVLNHGTIIGRIYQAGGDDLLRNTGQITGDIYTDNGNDRLDNRGGTITGTVSTGDGNDTANNRSGLIVGDVELLAGNDLYDGRDGEVTGTVNGGLGDDRFIGNAEGVDVFDAGGGSDVLDFHLGGAVTLALDGSFDAAGAATGDSYTGFERVAGSAQADHIRGNGSGNVISGGGGADLLDGATGADVLYGGSGVDTLTGGAGNDTFRFLMLADIGDRITDFHNASGDNDRFQIDASSFGVGLAAGVLPATAFQSRADNLAQDAGDRFIFRTTDRTLWFDADGNGTGAAVMVADLQWGATLTAANIELI